MAGLPGGRVSLARGHERGHQQAGRQDRHRQIEPGGTDVDGQGQPRQHLLPSGKVQLLIASRSSAPGYVAVPAGRRRVGAARSPAVRGRRRRELSNHSDAKPRQTGSGVPTAAARSPQPTQGLPRSSVCSEAPWPHRSQVGSWSTCSVSRRRRISSERLMRGMRASRMPWLDRTRPDLGRTFVPAHRAARMRLGAGVAERQTQPA
jgi:hypothetical protein